MTLTSGHEHPAADTSPNAADDGSDDPSNSSTHSSSPVSKPTKSHGPDDSSLF
ncbi:hypothetical protein ACFTWH_23145 [Streptomyces sp. NPDC057011]|uniref:hypothetical protein n=1 Tax=unclassified Streptomyces TaxID=2593676 RepID=UPI00363EBBB8